MARGVKIEDWETEEALALLKSVSSLTMEQIAKKVIGLKSRRTLYNWCRKSEAINKALQQKVDEETRREVEAEVILLAKSIDGVYDDDPGKNPAAKKYDEVTIDEVIAKNLQVVDMTASIMARDNKMPMWVFSLNEENSIVNTVKGKFNGTKVTV